MVDDTGRVLSKLESPTDAHRGYLNGLERIIGMLRETAQHAGVQISGIGIGSTGMVYPSSGAFGDVDFLPGWRGNNPVEDLARALNVTVALENDADASALGEASWGAGRGKPRLVYVTVGTGIGGGIIFDGQLYRGADMAHPEVGHHVIDPSGPLCTCGFRGCWESLATGPDMIVLGGSVMKSAALFLDGIRKVISQGCRFVPFEKTELALASLGENANLIGAARVWHHRFRQGVGRAS